jgi:hypothetical protein
VLPFGSEGDVDLHELKLGRVIEATPSVPVEHAGLVALVGAMSREFPYVEADHVALDGRLGPPPAEPTGSADQRLHVLDQAALFIAPKTSYFLVSDLELIGRSDADVQASALKPLRKPRLNGRKGLRQSGRIDLGEGMREHCYGLRHVSSPNVVMSALIWFVGRVQRSNHDSKIFWYVYPIMSARLISVSVTQMH